MRRRIIPAGWRLEQTHTVVSRIFSSTKDKRCKSVDADIETMNIKISSMKKEA